MSLKILALATTFPRWENDTEPPFVYELSKRLTNCFDTTILVPHYTKAKQFEVMDKLKVHRFKYFFPKYEKLCYAGGILPNLKKNKWLIFQIPFLLISEFFTARRLIKKIKPDIIHAHWVIPQGFIAFLLKKIYKIPYITTAHAGDVFTIKSAFLKKIARLVINNAAVCTANSNYTKKTLFELSKNDQIKVIPMGVDLSSFHPNKKDDSIKNKMVADPLLLFVGRLAPKKGIKYLIKAFPPILKRFPKSKLIIIGEGPEKNKLIELTKNLELNNHILFLGAISNKILPRYYATADVFICPSIILKSGDTEGLGVVLLEAVASGTAVIGTDVGGIPDIIKNNETGLLVEQKNSVQLAESIIKLLEDKELREKLIKNAQQHVKNNFGWDIIVKKFKECYKKRLQI